MSAAASSPPTSSIRSPLLNPGKGSDSRDSESEKLCIDGMLQKHCGEFGWWQLRHFVLTSLAWALEALHTMVMIFADRDPGWRCLDGALGSGCSPEEKSVCSLRPGSWEWIGGSGTSTVVEWALYCSDRYKVGLVQALFFFGCMIGAGIFGHLSDSKLGRKGSLVVVCIFNALLGILTAFSPDFWTYAVLRCLTGFSTGGVGLCAFVLATEPVGPTKRGVAGMSTFYFFSGGICLLSGVAYIFQSWRILYVATSIPSVIFLVAIIPFLSESPRWCLIRGNIKQAMETMQKIAKANGEHLPESVALALDDEPSDDYHRNCNGSKGLESVRAVSGSLLDVLRSPLTRTRLFLAVAINFTCAVVYYGLSLNVVNLGTNIYFNVFLNAVAEMPAFTLTAAMLDRFGRKPLAIGTQWFSGIFCLAGFLLGGHGKAIRMICGLLGIFGMAGTYNLLFIYTVELFPTVVRNAALGCTTQASQMGAILAPVVVVLGQRFPFLMFGACGVVGGAFAFYLPETLNMPLYDTMAGIEDAEKEKDLLV